ncbi:EF-hand domain-containing protein [Streptomyces sirii]|uniref:EF-hand domain-containing protein n=1 Tax=Streptomyces sirii TaxID=3127701 RepID=UPI003D365F98
MANTVKRSLFTMLDTDKDGVISTEDYLVRTELAAAAMGREDGDPVVLAARVAREALWADMDANGDGQVTFEEYEAWAGRDSFERVCRRAIGSLFDIADLDEDGALSRVEFMRLRQALGNSASNIATAFDVLDRNGDGLIDRDEYLNALGDFVSGLDSPMAVALHGGGVRVPAE